MFSLVFLLKQMSQNSSQSQRKKDAFYHPSLPQLPEEAGAKQTHAQGKDYVYNNIAY